MRALRDELIASGRATVLERMEVNAVTRKGYRSWEVRAVSVPPLAASREEGADASDAGITIHAEQVRTAHDCRK
jgi:hypothetical protein